MAETPENTGAERESPENGDILSMEFHADPLFQLLRTHQPNVPPETISRTTRLLIEKIEASGMQVPDGLSELIMSDDGSLVLLQLPVRDVAEATVADTGTADGFPVTVPLVFRPVPDGPPLRPGA